MRDASARVSALPPGRLGLELRFVWLGGVRILDKIEEGLGKNAPPLAIAEAARSRLRHMEQARTITRQRRDISKRGEQEVVRAVALALESGVSDAVLARVRTAFIAGHRGPLCLAVIGALLATEPDIVVAGEASDGLAAVAEAGRLAPDVVLMDLVMPGVDGLSATHRISADWPETRILVLTSFAGVDKIMPAIKAGALGYLDINLRENGYGQKSVEASLVDRQGYPAEKSHNSNPKHRRSPRPGELIHGGFHNRLLDGQEGGKGGEEDPQEKENGHQLPAGSVLEAAHPGYGAKWGSGCRIDTVRERRRDDDQGRHQGN